MRLTSSRAYSRPAPVPKMPPGLVELMNGLTKEVLRHNPTNVYEFCANHMEKLIEIRDGPSPKKSMTLEQKIEKAQEKMREKAKKRREQFDKEMNLLNSKQATAQVKENTILDQGSSSSTVKALVHREVDLQNASEVEISLNQSNATEFNTDLKPHISEVTQIKTGDSEIKPISENKNPEILPDLKTSNEEIDNKSDKKSGNVTIFENLETELTNKPLKETELKDIAGESTKKSGNVTIFDNLETELTNEPLKETELKDIAGESTLQTIKETFEENVVHENATILPKITIDDGHEMREFKNISGESFTEAQDHVDQDVKRPQDIQGQSEDLKVNAVLDNNTADDSNHVSNSDLSSGIVTNVIHNTENQLEVTTIDKNNLSEASDASESNVSGHTTIEIADNTIGEVSIHENHDGADDHLDTTSTAYNNDVIKLEATNVVSESDNSLKVIEPSEKNQNTREANKSEIDQSKLNMPDIEEVIKVGVEPVVNTNEAQINSVSGIVVTQSNITDDDRKVDAQPIENKESLNEENTNPDIEKLQHPSDPLLSKSETNDSTNEDIGSMVEFELPKTEDDTQNNPNMDLETAAVTIQKVFRSFMFKSRNSTFEDNINDENNSVDEDNDKKEEYYAAANLSKERRTLGITRMESVLQTVNEEKSLSLSTDDSSTLSSAATTIQAHVRGFLVRNRLNSSKTFSMNSLVNSHEVLESDPEQHKSKTILNIHIVPEEGNFLSRDESLITSMDLSLDGSPPSSVNLHPMSCDISERRKMLKREDAVQSVSPPSNNSGKLSEDSVKEVLINENGVLERDLTDDKTTEMDDQCKELDNEISDVISSASTATPTTIITISKSEDPIRSPREETEEALRRNVRSFTKLSADESDVITPFVSSPRSSEDCTLVHSGEFHDVVLPTKVSRNDAPVVSEFKNVLVYFLLWNSS